MKNSKLLRSLFRSTFITMFFVEMSNTVSCVVDGLVTSRFLGGEQMAAYGIAAPYFSIAAIISGILMVGGQNMCAKSLGSGDKKSADKAFSTLCITGFILSILLAVLGFLFSDRIAILFGAREEYAKLLPYTSQYLKGLFLGTPFFVMLAVLAPLVQLDGGAKTANIASAAVAVVDIAADLIGIVVFHGNLLVIAIATALSYLTGFVILLTHFAGKRAGFRFRIHDFEKGTIKDLIIVGLPRGASMLCRAIGPIITNMIVLKIANTAGMTAMSVQTNVKFFVGAPACGIAGAVLLLSSLYVGERDKKLLKETMVESVRYSLIIVGGIAAATFALSDQIAAFYLPNDAFVARMAVSAIRWYALSLPLMAVNLSLASFLQATGKTSAAYMMNIGSELVCVVTSVLILSGIFGINGVWAAFPAGQLMLLLLYIVNTLVQREKPSLPLDVLLCIKKNFGVSDENRLSASMRTISDVNALSKKARSFCLERGVDEKRSFLSSLFVEEMAGNVIEHGFSDKKKHLLETVITVDSREVIIHVRDDCRKFDLKEKAEHWKLDPEHPEKNIGIRMVLAMAKDVSYAGALNTNNVIVKI